MCFCRYVATASKAKAQTKFIQGTVILSLVLAKTLWDINANPTAVGYAYWLRDQLFLNLGKQDFEVKALHPSIQNVNATQIIEAFKFQHIAVKGTHIKQEPITLANTLFSMHPAQNVLDLRSFPSFAHDDTTFLIELLTRCVNTHFKSETHPRYLIVRIDTEKEVGLLADRFFNTIEKSHGTPFSIHTEITNRQKYPTPWGLEAANQFRENIIWGIESSLATGQYTVAKEGLNALRKKYPAIDFSDSESALLHHQTNPSEQNADFANRQYHTLWNRVWGNQLNEAMMAAPIIVIVSNTFDITSLKDTLSAHDFAYSPEIAIVSTLTAPMAGILPAQLWGLDASTLDCHDIMATHGGQISYSPQKRAIYDQFMQQYDRHAEAMWEDFHTTLTQAPRSTVTIPENSRVDGPEGLDIAFSIVKEQWESNPHQEILGCKKQSISRMKRLLTADTSVPFGARVFSRYETEFYVTPYSSESVSANCNFVFASFARSANSYVEKELPHLRLAPALSFDSGVYILSFSLADHDRYAHDYKHFYDTVSVPSLERMITESLTKDFPHQGVFVGLGFGIPHQFSSVFESGIHGHVNYFSHNAFFRLPEDRSLVNSVDVRKFSLCAQYAYGWVQTAV